MATAKLSGEVEDDMDVESRTAEEPEIINAGAIPSVLNHDTEEIANESDVVLDTGIGGSALDDEEVDDNNANSSSAQCIHPINPSQPPLDQDCRGDDQNGNHELDSSDILCDSFHRTLSPYPAEIIHEAEVVLVDDSKVNAAAVVSCSQQSLVHFLI